MVVRRDPLHEIGLGLVRDHLDDIGEVLALGRELDDVTVDDVADRDAPRDLRTPSFERSVSTKRLPERARKGGGGDLEAAHRAAAVLAVGHGLDAVARR